MQILLTGCKSVKIIVNDCPPPIFPTETVAIEMEKAFPDSAQDKEKIETKNWYFDIYRQQEQLEICHES